MITQTAMDLLPSIRFIDVCDIVLVSGLLYVLLVALRKTRTTFLIGGLISLAGIYVVALAVGLRLTSYLFQMMFAAIVLGLIVIFHDEIRLSVERLLRWDLRERIRSRSETTVVPESIQILVTVLTDLAKDRIGALVVIQGRDDLTRHVHGGVALDGSLSEALLMSIFDTHSIGHDGAVLIAEDNVMQFGAHLPLSNDARQLRNRGTRHAAALGLSAKTDCLCLVVSEERGVVSTARHGKLQEIREASDLTRAISDFQAEKTTARKATVGRDLLKRHLGLKIASLLIATVLWFLVVHEGAVEYRSYSVAIEHAGLSPDLAVSSLSPTRARVIVSGPRRSFYFVDQHDFMIHAKLFELGTGSHEVTLTATDLSLPSGITFVNVVPRNILVTVEDES